MSFVNAILRAKLTTVQGLSSEVNKTPLSTSFPLVAPTYEQSKLTNVSQQVTLLVQVVFRQRTNL